jgi:hypothetical protein
MRPRETKLLRRRLIPLLALAAIAQPRNAPAAESSSIGEGTVTVTGALTAGTMMRTADRMPALVFGPNAAVVGQTGTAPAGRNSDDGDLNYKRNDLVSSPLRASLRLEWTREGYGAVAQGMAWYDQALASTERPFGNLPNGYATGQPLGQRGFSSRERFWGAAPVEANAYGTVAVGPAPLHLRAGWQRMPWGVQTSIAGGLEALTPDDHVAALRPGTSPEEKKVPVPAVYARLGSTDDGPRVEAFYQLWRAASTLPGCGTFFQTNDYVTGGCDKILLATSGSDAQSLAAGAYVSKERTVAPSSTGQFGAGIGYASAAWGTDVAAYYARYHSRTPAPVGIKTGRTSTPVIPGNPDGLNAAYFMEYPEAIQLLGLTAVSRTRIGQLSLELTYRPNQPVVLNGSDLLAALTSNVAPTPLRADAEATPYGGTYPGYDRRQVGQAVLGYGAVLERVLGARSAFVAAEAGAKEVFDLPNTGARRYGRSDLFGLGPVNGVCIGTDPAQCSNRGYVTGFSWGYRVKLGATYGDPVRFAVSPRIGFAHDVSGYSPDGVFNAGRRSLSLGLRTETSGRYTAEVTWVPTWGGTYNALRDRSFATAVVGVTL